jgi:hypothetical protein
LTLPIKKWKKNIMKKLTKMIIKRKKEDNITYKIIIWKNGTKWWLFNNKYHRIGGPAIEINNGNIVWFLDGLLYNYEEYIKEIYKRYGAGQVMLLRAKYG